MCKLRVTVSDVLHPAIFVSQIHFHLSFVINGYRHVVRNNFLIKHLYISLLLTIFPSHICRSLGTQPREFNEILLYFTL